jgi:hypothetical protein
MRGCIGADCTIRARMLLDPLKRIRRVALGSGGRHASAAMRCGEQALVDEAIVAYRNAVECNPRAEPAPGDLLFALLHRCESPAEFLHEARRWARFAVPQLPPPVAFRNAAIAERRLRIGYVSADLCGSLLAFHDEERFELFCYDGTAQPDPISAKLKQHRATWRPAGNARRRSACLPGAGTTGSTSWWISPATPAAIVCALSRGDWPRCRSAAAAVPPLRV